MSELTDRGTRSPLTDLQQAYWLGRHAPFELAGTGASYYVEVDAVDVDIHRYTSVWRDLVEDYAALRTIVTGPGEQQVLATVPELTVGMLDLRAGSDEARSERLAAIRAELLDRRFEPDQWPLFELRASLLDERHTRLHIVIDLLVCDADSLSVLGSDLERRYQGSARSTATAPTLRESQRPGQLRPADGDAGVDDYWRDRVRTLPPAPQPPLARDPGQLNRPRMTRRQRRLPAAQWEHLRDRTGGLGVTTTAALLAAFGEVLAGWSAQRRYTLTVAVSARPPAAATVVGHLTELSLVDLDADPGVALAPRAQSLQEQVREVCDPRRVGGIDAIREFARISGAQFAAPAPVVFASRLADQPEPMTAGWPGGLGKVGFAVTQSPQTWLWHDVAEEAGDLVVTWDTVDDLFPPGWVDNLVDAHRELLGRLAETSEAWTAVGAEFLPEPQRRVREQVNATGGPLPPTLLHEVFWEQADRTPEAPAVVSDARTLSYRELRAGATVLASQLRKLGARPNQLVAIVMDKGWEQPLAVLGILGAGAAYVPVEPDLPAERFEYLLRHSEATIAVTQPALAEQLPWPAGVQVVVADERMLSPATGGAEADRGAPRWSQGQQDLAYVIYTSGSTGLPKGVMINHQGVLNTVLDINRRFDVGPADRMLALTPLSFDLSAYDLFGLWAAGGALVMPEAGTGRAPWHWADLMERHGVTLWNTVPALMEMLVGYVTGRRQRLVDSLRLVLMSGDWIPVPLPDRIRERAAPGTTIVSLGGATEASIWSIGYVIGDVDPAWASIPYGTPLTNQRFEVLDTALRRRPDWVPGDQYVAGAGVALGYWRDEEKTRKAFIRHPRTGERLYRMGDLGRYFPDGNMEFLGRADFQVKVHGYRIELGEIEAALLSQDEVVAAVVTAIGDPHGEKRLIGYVTTQGDSPGVSAANDVFAKTLREYLNGKLPSYMVPAHIMVLDELPLTRNGKVDRKALPVPQTEPGQTDGYQPPVGGLETRLTAIWQELLGDRRISATDDYFAMGATSLSVARAHHRIAAELAPGLGLDVMFQQRTIRALATYLDTG